MKKGDKIVCVDNKGCENITLYKVYIIVDDNSIDSGYSYPIINDRGHLDSFFSHRFIGLKEYRKMKIELLEFLNNE